MIWSAVLVHLKGRGIGIRDGNASLEVQRAARRVTTSNTDEGFATVVDKLLLSGG